MYLIQLTKNVKSRKFNIFITLSRESRLVFKRGSWFQNYDFKHEFGYYSFIIIFTVQRERSVGPREKISLHVYIPEVAVLK